MDSTRSYTIKTYLYRRFYVCPTFYKVYMKLDKAEGIFASFQGSEVIFVCQECLADIKKYVTKDKPYFFDEAKKLLIEYYIPISESCREMRIENRVSAAVNENSN